MSLFATWRGGGKSTLGYGHGLAGEGLGCLGFVLVTALLRAQTEPETPRKLSKPTLLSPLVFFHETATVKHGKDKLCAEIKSSERVRNML